MSKITLSNLSNFERGYITAALFTFDDVHPSGQYEDSGRVEELFPLIDQDALMAMVEGDCRKFQEENKILLAQAGDDSQNGHDFWLSRNRHGAGFFDRGYDNEIESEGVTLTVGDVLTDKCHAFGECDIYYGDDGKIYYQAL